MEILRHYGRVTRQNGQPRLWLSELLRFNKHLESLEGKEIELLLSERFVKVSKDQHAYYRAAVIGAAARSEQFGGWTKNQIHNHFAGKFFGIRVHRIIKGKITEQDRVISLAEVSKAEMAQYIEWVMAELATEGIIVESSDTFYEGSYKTKTVCPIKNNTGNA